MKIKKGDEVVVVSGRSKGLRGTVLEAYPDTDRVLVEGVNRITKNTAVSYNQRGAKSGGVVTQEAPIHVSNVMLVSGGKRTRVGHRFDEDGRKVRVARKTGEDV
jgi:large subunit ribosomal protein L24